MLSEIPASIKHTEGLKKKTKNWLEEHWEMSCSHSWEVLFLLTNLTPCWIILQLTPRCLSLSPLATAVVPLVWLLRGGGARLTMEVRKVFGKVCTNLEKFGHPRSFEDLELGQFSSQGSKDPRDYLLILLEFSRNKVCAKGDSYYEQSTPGKLGAGRASKRGNRRLCPTSVG